MPVPADWFKNSGPMSVNYFDKRLSLLAILVLCDWPVASVADTRLNRRTKKKYGTHSCLSVFSKI
jgi:hypothetical protein